VCRTVLEASNTGVAIAPDDIELTCDPACASGLGHRVTVRVVGEFHLLTPFLTPFFGGRSVVDFSAASTQQIETFPPAPSPVILTSAPPTTAPSSAPSAAPSGAPSAAPSAAPTEVVCVVPSAGFTYTASPNNRKAPVTVSLTDTSTSVACGITSWFWDFGDGSTSLVKNPGPKTYLAPGSYTVSLTVANAAGSSTSGAVIIEVRR
jgi:PKD repeat protein